MLQVQENMQPGGYEPCGVAQCAGVCTAKTIKQCSLFSSIEHIAPYLDI